MNRRVLIVDDDATVREDYRRILSPEENEALSEIERFEKMLFPGEDQPSSAEGPVYSLHFAAQGKDGYDIAAKARAEGAPIAVAFIDLRMPPGWDGMETAVQIQREDPDIEIVIVTAYADHDRQSIIKAVSDPSKILYLKKPFDPDEIRQLAHSLTDKWNLAYHEREYRKLLEDLLPLFSSMQLNVENERELLIQLFGIIVRFYGAPRALLRFAGTNGAEVYATHPANLSRDEIAASPVLPPSVAIVKPDTLAIPLRLASGEGEIVLDLTGVKMNQDNAKLLGSIVVSNLTNVLNSYHFQRATTEKSNLAAVGNAVDRIIHDINNPLSTIFGYASLIEKGRGLSEKDTRRLKGILAASDSIRRMIASLHDLVTPDLHMNRSEVNACELITRVVLPFKSVLEKLDTELELVVPSEPLPLLTDPQRFEASLTALLDNATDAVEKGRSKRKVSVISEISGEHLCIRVSDTGVGIPEDLLQKVWMPFFSYGRKGKMGLGLALVRKFANVSGGSVSIESDIHSGTTITLLLPVG